MTQAPSLMTHDNMMVGMKRAVRQHGKLTFQQFFCKQRVCVFAMIMQHSRWRLQINVTYINVIVHHILLFHQRCYLPQTKTEWRDREIALIQTRLMKKERETVNNNDDSDSLARPSLVRSFSSSERNGVYVFLLCFVDINIAT